MCEALLSIVLITQLLILCLLGWGGLQYIRARRQIRTVRMSLDEIFDQLLEEGIPSEPTPLVPAGQEKEQCRLAEESLQTT